MKPFAFIALEGLDCSGKSRQAKLLAESLRAKGYDVLEVNDPGTTPMGKMIREILLNPSNKEHMSAYTELMLFSAARASLISYIQAEAAKRPKLVVISDRFIHSTLAYQGFGRKLDRQRVINSISASCSLFATLTIYLDVTEETIQQRMGRRSSDERPTDRMDQESQAFRARTRQGYVYYSKNVFWKWGNVETIDANGERDIVASDILQAVTSHLDDQQVDLDRSLPPT